ncbi:MAG: hypothetical protein AAF734_01165 [Bacteroidota bacterium]
MIFYQLESSPAPVHQLWEGLTTEASSNNLTDDDLQRFLTVVPEDITEAQADQIIDKLSESSASTAAEWFTLLHQALLDLYNTALSSQKTTSDSTKTGTTGTPTDTTAADTTQIEKKVRRNGLETTSKEAKSTTLTDKFHYQHSAKQAAYDGQAGSETVGTLAYSWDKSYKDSKDKEVEISMTCYNLLGNSDTIPDVAVKIEDVIYYKVSNGKATKTLQKATADHVVVKLKIVSGVEFILVGSPNGCLPTGTILEHTEKLKN